MHTGGLDRQQHALHDSMAHAAAQAGADYLHVQNMGACRMHRQQSLDLPTLVTQT